jgi:hypothetical protein
MDRYCNSGELYMRLPELLPVFLIKLHIKQ